MYAIVKTGGKQYRVSEGQWLLVERLAVEEGATVDLQTLLVVDGDSMRDGEDLAGTTVKALVLGHERGPKLRIVKFKPKRGYKRRNGHRQELTRIQITSLGDSTSDSDGGSAPVAAPAVAPTTEEGSNGA
jgi:large subunit ribosomal protein L21